MALLRSAKKNELQLAGVRNPSGDAVGKAITKAELARHCRRKTRGVQNTTILLENLFLSFMDATDTLGVPLLCDDAIEILNTEKKAYILLARSGRCYSLHKNRRNHEGQHFASGLPLWQRFHFP